MNSPVEPMRPEDFASAYQKGINVFQVNNGTVKMSDFLSWYKHYVLENYSVSHQVQITSIRKLPEKNRYKMINFYGHTAKVLFMIAPRF